MDREKAIQILTRCEAEPYCAHYKERFCCVGCGQRDALDIAIEALGEVHCCDCKHWDGEDDGYKRYPGMESWCGNDSMGWCEMYRWYTPSDCSCSDGKRSEGVR